MTRNRKTYPGDLTEAQAELLLPLIPPAKEGGRPRMLVFKHRKKRQLN